MKIIIILFLLLKTISDDTFITSGGLSCDIEDSSKIDCGYYGIDQNSCENKGCCWYMFDNNTNNIPFCFYGKYIPTTILITIPTTMPTTMPTTIPKQY